MKTIRLTMGQAIVKYLIAQRTLIDGEEKPLFPGVFAIFGHGNFSCLGEALESERDALPTWRGQNEQSMALAGVAYARAMRRRQIMVATASVGPGATNMLTAAATAASNRLPLLLLGGDTFTNRLSHPILQSVEMINDPTCTVNDAFRSVCQYWDRIVAPEQLISSLPNAVHVMLDPADCGPTFLGLPQDTQGIAYDYPEAFFTPTVHRIRRPRADTEDLVAAAEVLRGAKKPLIIAGGGVHYSLATEEFRTFAEQHNIPIVETIAGRATVTWDHPLNTGSLGVFGFQSANNVAAEADVVFAVGTKLADFPTASWTVFQNPDMRLVALNASRFDATKHRALAIVGDAQVGLTELSAALGAWRAPQEWSDNAAKESAAWNEVLDRYTGPTNAERPTYANVIGAVNRICDPTDIVVAAAGGLPHEVTKAWRAQTVGAFDCEFGFSCMGYEIAGAWGAKMARPDREIITFCGDGSYLMMNSDIYSSVMTGHKVIAIVCDNGGFAVVDRLAAGVGTPGFNNLWETCNVKEPFSIDFAKHAEAMGAIAETVVGINQFEEAFKRAKAADRTYVIHIKTDRGDAEWIPPVAWWDCQIPEINERETVREARAKYVKGKEKQRAGV
jgi:3D-(3,5/4)-trihydroxycyclohexane-1,2-dione acylhydrolase (decyclizing)